MPNRNRLAISALALFILVVLCCNPNLISARAAQENAAPQKTTTDVDSVHCPDATLDTSKPLNPKSISSLTKGIQGLPCDAVFVPVDPQPQFDYYSWLTFIALNSPADGNAIGKDAGTLWETWKQLPDVMLANGVQPQPWTIPNPQEAPPACKEQSKNNPRAMIIHMEMEETYNQPFKSGPLFDQNGNYALFVIFMNQHMFQYIADHNLFSVSGQQQFKDEVDFPDGINPASGNGKIGSVMIKGSWKLLGPKDDFSKYHVIDGLLYLPHSTPACRAVKLGLIGFHVGHKTVSRQQWIWTTFEHHNNVPNQREVDDKTAGNHTYSFFDSSRLDTPINATPDGPWDPDKLVPPWVPFEHPSKFKSQIVRMGPTPEFPDIDELNNAFHAWLGGTVWSNYDLITTQWPSAFPCAALKKPGELPDPTCAPFPTFLANTTLETFSQQLKAEGVPLASSSCISCHNNATTHHMPATRSDFTYILEKAQGKPMEAKK